MLFFVVVSILLPPLYRLNISNLKLKLRLNEILSVFVCVVLNNGHYCSLLEVTDRSRSTTNVPKLLQELEIQRVVSLTNFDVLNGHSDLL